MKKTLIDKFILIASVYISLRTVYHILGTTSVKWNVFACLIDNLLVLSMSFLLLNFKNLTLKRLVKYVFIPYFLLKCIYQITCYFQVKILPAKVWDFIWTYILVACILIGLVIYRKMPHDKELEN